jgi:polyisoprenoid-binding protein YceI
MAIQPIWTIDPSQSKIAFKVSYMQLGVITGEFRLFHGFVESDDVFDELTVGITVDSRSVTTFHALRDEGIRSAVFFDTMTYPVIRFTSTDFLRVSSGGLFELTGLLTIRNSTFPVQVMVSLTSLMAGEAVFKFSGTLSRQAFGLEGPATPDGERVADAVEFFGEMCIRREH